ncbi:cupin domain-containing protein [Streptomyces cadmiisoli]|nr:cupin domain-containing protein [Streptomyces cadmiisoli]
MTFNFAVPDKDDPVWTSADGFVVRNEEGIVRLTGEERFAVRVTGAQSNGRLGVMEGTVAPRFGNVPHTHRQEDEAFLILSGRFRFINGDQTFEAGPGDFVYIPHGTRHGFKNILDVPSKMMVFYTPAGPEQFFVDHGMREDTYDPQEWANRLRNDTALQKALAGMNMSLLPGGHDWAE